MVNLVKVIKHHFKKEATDMMQELKSSHALIFKEPNYPVYHDNELFEHKLT